MKTFKVTRKAEFVGHDEILLASEQIEAGYMKLENGHLIFRRNVHNGYPETLRVFAPGTWRECELVRS